MATGACATVSFLWQPSAISSSQIFCSLLSGTQSLPRSQRSFWPWSRSSTPRSSLASFTYWVRGFLAIYRIVTLWLLDSLWPSAIALVRSCIQFHVLYSGTVHTHQWEWGGAGWISIQFHVLYSETVHTHQWGGVGPAESAYSSMFCTLRQCTHISGVGWGWLNQYTVPCFVLWDSAHTSVGWGGAGWISIQFHVSSSKTAHVDNGTKSWIKLYIYGWRSMVELGVRRSVKYSDLDRPVPWWKQRCSVKFHICTAMM